MTSSKPGAARFKRISYESSPLTSSKGTKSLQTNLKKCHQADNRGESTTRAFDRSFIIETVRYMLHHISINRSIWRSIVMDLTLTRIRSFYSQDVVRAKGSLQWLSFFSHFQNLFQLESEKPLWLRWSGHPMLNWDQLPMSHTTHYSTLS